MEKEIRQTIPNTDKKLSSSKRCEEVQDIVDRMPVWFASVLTYVVALLALIVFVLSCIISYPDTVDGRVTLTSGMAPVRMVAPINGKLKLHITDKGRVRSGDVIASFDQATHFETVVSLDSLLSRPFHNQEDSLLRLCSYQLGDLSNAYNQYLLQFSLYKQHLYSRLFEAQIASLMQQIASDEQTLRLSESNKAIRSALLALSRSELSKDSLLLLHKAITEEVYHQQVSQNLQSQESYCNSLINSVSVQSRIETNTREIARIQIERREQQEKLSTELLSLRSNLQNQLLLWKNQFLLTAPIDGTIEYLGFWRDYVYVAAGKEIVSIIPTQEELYGEVQIPTGGVGKVKIGQSVRVKIDNYPYDEYGYIAGEVQKLSKIPTLYPTKDGQMDSYLVTINLPQGPLTNYGILLNIDFESKGTAEIITKSRKLIERLFDNLSAIKER